MLQHISECPCLSDSWYWCPYCRRPERFLSSDNTTIHQLQRKESKLKRAVTFFKHLGLRNCLRHKRPRTSSAPELECFDTKLAERERCEMEDTSPTPMELAANDSDSHRLRSNSEKQSKIVCELDVPGELQDLPQYTRDASVSVELYELDGIHDSTAANRNSKVSLMGMGDQSLNDHHGTGSQEQALVSPVSADPCPFICQTPRIDMSLGVEYHLHGSSSINPGAVLSPTIVNQDWSQSQITPALSNSLLTFEVDGSECDIATFSSQLQVEELRNTVSVLNAEWLRRSQTTPDLVLHASSLSPKQLFETGVQTLQQIYKGILPQTFDAIFSLAHITCASMYTIHGLDQYYCWNEFFQDMLRWQHLLPNKSDAQSYIRLVNLLWWPQGSSEKLSCGNYFLDGTSGTLVPLRKPAMAFDISSSIENDDWNPPQGPKTRDSISVLHSLKEGPVLRECSRLLDGKSAHQHSTIIV